MVKRFRGDAAYIPAGVIALPDSGSVILVKRNERELNTAFESDLYYTKLDKYGNIVKPVPVSTIEYTQQETPPKNWFLYPNPTKDVLYLNQNNQSLKYLTLQIYNLQGQLVLSKKINSDNIQISHLPKGIYTYALKQSQKQVSSDKFLKF